VSEPKPIKPTGQDPDSGWTVENAIALRRAAKLLKGIEGADYPGDVFFNAMQSVNRCLKSKTDPDERLWIVCTALLFELCDWEEFGVKIDEVHPLNAKALLLREFILECERYRGRAR